MIVEELRRLQALHLDEHQPFPLGAGDGVRLDARFHLNVIPAALRRIGSATVEPSDSMWGHGSRCAGPWGEPPPVGLSPARNSDTPRRNGWKGLTPLGKRRIRTAAATMEDARRRCVFWTVTLPGDALDQIAALDSLSKFTDHLRRCLQRRLGRAGLPRWAVGVIELQPGRTVREGRPCPHWHVLFIGKRAGRRVWALHTSVLDGIIGKALAAAGVSGVDTANCGQVEPVKKSVAGYMAKYLTKDTDLSEVCVAQLELIPRQWWFETRALQTFVRGTMVCLPIAFALWVLGNKVELEAKGLCWVSPVEIPDPRAPACWAVNWSRPGAVAEALALWDLGERVMVDAQLMRLRHDGNCSRLDPLGHQHV